MRVLATNQMRYTEAVTTLPACAKAPTTGKPLDERGECFVKIAQIAPLWHSMPSRGPSDGERALSYLTEELVRRGHEVTLFASADSRTSATLEVLCSTPLDRTPESWSRAGAAILAVEQVFGPRADEFDLIHSHFGIDGFPMAQRCTTPTVTTLYGRLDLPEYIPMFKQFRNLPLVSTSNLQRRPLEWASWQETIYPGEPSELYRFNPRPGKYLAFIGSLSMEEGLGVAIEIARRAHLPLRVASPKDSIDGQPLSTIPSELLVADNGVGWLGELTEPEKIVFMGGALALVCTQTPPGSFAPFVAEALACGTPVVAFHDGYAADMIYDHVTGFACDSIGEMVDVLPLVRDLDRRACRDVFEKRFSAERMTDQYVHLYERLIAADASHRRFSASIVQAVQIDRRPMAVTN
jgi:glycosyltransferase involved in cell wall biosynthesis